MSAVFLISSKIRIREIGMAGRVPVGKSPAGKHPADLSDEPHNAFFKVFASRTREKRISLDLLMKNKAVLANTEIIWLLRGLAACWFQFTGEAMENELTPEKAMELGKRFEDLMISSIPLEKILDNFGPDEIIEKVGRNRILDNFGPDEIIEKVGRNRILDNFGPDEIIHKFVKDRLVAKLRPEDRLAGLSVEELELYLEKLKKKKK